MLANARPKAEEKTVRWRVVVVLAMPQTRRVAKERKVRRRMVDPVMPNAG